MSVGSDATEDPKARPPLGLPTGSVRAFLTLLIVGVVIVESVRGHALPELWSETLLIALAHYFTSRRFIGLRQNALAQLESQGLIEKESNPLYLPRHSIRAIIVLAFAGLAYYLIKEQGKKFHELPPVLVTVAAYLLGTFARAILVWRAKGSVGKVSRLWEDVKALAVILVLGGVAAAYCLGHGDMVDAHFRNATLALVLFYFGSR
jgi:hypothetical protein